MKKLISAVCLAACAIAAPAFAQTTVGVSVGINQPGLYGRIEIGNHPQPVVINPQPIIITQPVVVAQTPVVARQPVYMYVPPGHQKKWGKHCHKYNACAQPVYFVQEQWVHDRYKQEHPNWKGERHGHKGGQGKKDKHDKHDQKGKGHKD